MKSEMNTLRSAEYLTALASRVECPPFEGPQVNPTVFVKAKGAYLTDIDGKDYIDFCNGKGSIIVGHNDPVINSRIASSVLSDSNVVTGPTPNLVFLAQMLLEMAPSIKPMRAAFFPTGAESLRAVATMLRDTSKDGASSLILSSGWHGWDPMWRSSGRLLQPNHEGVVDVYFIPDLLESAIKKYGDKIAGFVISPDLTHLSAATLKSLFGLCRKHGIRIACDDVKQGLRYGPHSSLASIGEFADVYVFSKGLSNGRRISCVLGEQAILSAAAHYTYTNYFEASAIEAGIATLERMRELQGYQLLRTAGRLFTDESRRIFEKRKLPFEVRSSEALFQFVFPDDEIAREFYRSCLHSGLVFYFFDNQAPSAAFDSQVLSASLRRLEDALDRCDFPALCKGAVISQERLFWTAWRQMDGATDVALSTLAISWIEAALSEGRL